MYAIYTDEKHLDEYKLMKCKFNDEFIHEIDDLIKIVSSYQLMLIMHVTL